MAEGVLGLGQGQAASLNQDLIDQLKAADRKSTVEPIETSITDLGTETEKITEIKTKFNEFLETVKPFDLYVSTGTNAFELKSATTTGEAVIFDSEDDSKLNTGTTNVTITTLATRDVYESAKFTDKDATILGSNSDDDDLTITHSGTDYTFETNGKTYQELADDINNNSRFNATVEEVGTNEYRLVIKSVDSGLDNALTIGSAGSLELGFVNNVALAANEFTSTDTAASGTITLNGTSFTTNGTQTYADIADLIDADADFNAEFMDGNLVVSRTDGTDVSVTTDDFGFGLANDKGEHSVVASNLEATVDGVDYNVSSNEFVVGGSLKITATEPGTSTITIRSDTASIEPMMQNIVTKYNELIGLIDGELLSADSKVEDKSTLRTIMAQVKETLFGSYGTNDELSIFNYGFSTDANGLMTLNSSEFNTAVSSDFDNLKRLFIGVAEDEGLGTQLKTYVDSLDGFDGLITAYETNMTDRGTALEEEKTKAITDLDSRYEQMSQQFADYGVIINQMENSFAGLKLLINQSQS